MKKIMLLSFVSFFLLSATNPTSKISLYDAIQKKIISVNFKGNIESTHYYEPVIASIQNTTNESYEIICPNGFLLEPLDSNQQTLITTETQLLSLKPKQKINKKIKAMCIEQSDRAGNDKSIYTIKQNKDTLLEKISNFIDKNNYYTACAQEAVWTLVNKRSLINIYGADTVESKNLIKYIASITGWQIPKPVDFNSYKYNFYIPPKEKLSGSFTFGFKSEKDIQVAMFNTDGILVRELFNEKKVPITNNRIEYAFDFNTYTDDVYYVKLIVNNKVLMNRKIDAKSTRDKYKQMWNQQNR